MSYWYAISGYAEESVTGERYDENSYSRIGLGMPEREYNQGYIFYFPNVCVPITFTGTVTRFIFMSILTMYFLFVHRFYT